MVSTLFVLHGLCAIALLGAVTHQVLSVWWPARTGPRTFIGRFRAVQSAHYSNAIVVMFLVTFVLGSLVYPTYRVGARVFMENLRMGAAVGSFEVKEHLVSFGLGLLPAYWYVWRRPIEPDLATARAGATLILALFVWSAFLIGHVLNNIRGI